MPGQTIIDILRSRAEDTPGAHAFTYLLDGEQAEQRIGYGELDRRARAIASALQSRVRVGDRVLLVFAGGLDFVAGFFGCLYAGAIAVPVYPPTPGRPLDALEQIVADCQPALALTTADIALFAELLKRQSAVLGGLGLLAIDRLKPGDEAAWQPLASDPDALAFLQYTSGSTQSPKGVCISHGNLLHNQAQIAAAFGHTRDLVGMGWLPLYHDMGLIGNVLQTLYVGGSCVLMSPLDFLRKPLRWLQAISRFRATTSGGPNFAYELCVRRFEPAQLQGLDLGSWTLAFNGAEPIRADTLDRFARTYEPYGFRREALYPCYGLAEATLLVTGAARQAPPVMARVDAAALAHNQAVAREPGEPGAQTLIGCGQGWLGQHVVIAQPDTRVQAAPGQVGEIWVAGANVARGYWNKPEETEQAFGAHLAATGEGPFLRTGDLGFVRDGELFVTGRLKDLIIQRGRNIYPHDLELTAERSHPALRPGCGAAFGIEVDGQERVVLVQEVQEAASAQAPGFGEALEAIRQSVAMAHEVQLHAAVLIAPRTIAKTSSGKIRRSACKRAFLDGTLSEVARASWSDEVARAAAAGESSGESATRAAARAPETITEQEIAGIWQELLELPHVGRDDDFVRLGGDSLLAAQMINRVSERFGIELRPEVHDDLTVVHLATRVDELLLAKLEALSESEVQALLAAAEQPEPALPDGMSSSFTEHSHDRDNHRGK